MDTQLANDSWTTVDALMRALRAERRRLSKRALAELADLHPNTLARFDRDDWRPSIYTIRSLEIALLPYGLTQNGRVRQKPEDASPSGPESQAATRDESLAADDV